MIYFDDEFLLQILKIPIITSHNKGVLPQQGSLERMIICDYVKLILHELDLA